MNYVVIGTGYGDEGKGLVVDYLARQHGGIFTYTVCRTQGGQQCGHTVVTPEGKRHVFSNFGSGTFAGQRTYWGKGCTFDPFTMYTERNALLELGVTPVLWVDKLAMVTTPYDIAYNRAISINKFGTVGVGFGTTICRNEALTPYRFYVHDLFYPTVTKIRLEAIRKYYEPLIRETLSADETTPIFERYYEELAKMQFYIDNFSELVQPILESFEMVSEEQVFSEGGNFIFEGNQGILLDRDFGFFPHVTRSHTTSQEPMRIVRQYGLDYPEIYYVTRSYQTRHGYGPMNEGKLTFDIDAPNETNVFNEWQTDFRKAPLDMGMLDYALTVDSDFVRGCEQKIVVTCMDQIRGDWTVTDGGEIYSMNPIKFSVSTGFNSNTLFSYGPTGNDIRV